MNALITCCGRKVYLIDEIRKALKELFPGKRNEVLVAESDKYSPSLYYADKGFILPSISDGKYFKCILDICTRQKVSLLLPTKDTEISKFAQKIRVLRNENIKIPLSSPTTIKILEDKLSFFDVMKEKFKVPITFSAKDIELKDIVFPCIVKERGLGTETSGFYVCTGPEELRVAVKKLTEPILQEKIDGSEYTVDALFDMNNLPIAIVPRLRLKTRQYVSDVGVAVSDKYLLQACEAVAKFLKITGIVNFQWIKNAKGDYYLIEINPRISGGLQITLAACPQFILSLVKFSFDIGLKRLNYRPSILTMKYDSVISTKVP